jgi:hypothetical protein
MVRSLALDRLIHAHSHILGAEVLGDYLLDFAHTTAETKKAVFAGWTLAETLARIPMPDSDPRAPFMKGRHSYNVRRTYLWLKKDNEGTAGTN